MDRWPQVLLVVFVGVALAPAQEAPAGKLIADHWDAAFFDNNRAGYTHTTVVEYQQDGVALRRTTVDLALTLRRFNDTARLSAQSGTIETRDGKVLGVFMKQGLGREQTLELTGQVVGNELLVKVRGNMEMDRKVPWNDQVLGLYGELRIFQDKKAKPGDRFSYQHFEPLISQVVTVQVEVQDHEEVMIGPAKKKLLRAVATPDKILNVQLPPTTFWLDADLAVVRSRVEMPNLGVLRLDRTTKELALTPVVPAKMTDVGLTQLISLNRPLPDVNKLESVVYRVSIPNDAEPATCLVRDGRQEIKNLKGKSFDLHVRAIREPKKIDKPAPAADEFLKSNYFINSDDGRVKELAKKAVGAETDPWKKARRIEKWVHDNIQIQNFSESMTTADHVAKTLEGDCTEYAMLTAAMCRAVGIPSRTALGLVYVNMPKTGPALAYHMWTEVYVAGQWLALDATLGRGSVGVGHIKISDHSWHETKSLVPLLPITRVLLGKIAVEVVQVGGAD